MTRIIGLMGRAGSGKSTAARYLVDRYGATAYSFAGPLKEMVRGALDMTHEQVWGTQEQKDAVDPRYGYSPRWFMQRFGTEGCRAVFGADFWLTMTLKQIATEHPELAVIEDVRYVNEARAIMDRGEVWLLTIPHGSALGSPHASELEWSQAPYTCALRPPSMGVDILYRLVDGVMNEDLKKNA